MKQKKLSSGIAVVRWDNASEAYIYLLLRAYQYWDFPKGMVEKGEMAIDAAKREVEEETTINQLEFSWGKAYQETGPYRGGKVARYYIAETQQEKVELLINPEIGEPEHQEYQWASYSQAKEIVSPRVASVLDWVERVVNVSTEGINKI